MDLKHQRTLAKRTDMKCPGDERLAQERQDAEQAAKPRIQKPQAGVANAMSSVPCTCRCMMGDSGTSGSLTPARGKLQAVSFVPLTSTIFYIIDCEN